MNPKFSIQIPNPCHEDWNQMLPAEQGRFCQSCEKTVVDFSQMSDKQVLEYFKSKQQTSQRVCGRFRVEQVSSPTHHSYTSWPLSLQRFAMALVAVVLLGGASACHPMNQTVGDVVILQEDSAQDPISEDTLRGEVALPEELPVEPADKQPVEPVRIEPGPMGGAIIDIMGDVIVPEDPDPILMGIPEQAPEPANQVEDCGPRSLLKGKIMLMGDTLLPQIEPEPQKAFRRQKT
jgi:hypothetical protein